MKRERRIYDSAFKVKAVQLSKERDNISELAREIGAPDVSNTVTVTETTSPQNPYYMINPEGSIVFRPPYSNSNPPPVPPLPQRSYELTYTMCINNTGAVQFCADGAVVINYYYTYNRMMFLEDNVTPLIVTPNPSTSGIYTLLFDEAKTAMVEVHNMLGQKLYNEQIIEQKEYKLFLDNVAKGSYLLKVTSDEETVTKTIIKQ